MTFGGSNPDNTTVGPYLDRKVVQWCKVTIIVLRTFAGLVRFVMLGIAAKYDIKSIYFSTTTVKNAVWSSFVNVKF